MSLLRLRRRALLAAALAGRRPLLPPTSYLPPPTSSLRMAFRGRGGAAAGRGGAAAGGSTGSLQSAGASEAPKIAGVEWLGDTITCHAWNADRSSTSWRSLSRARVLHARPRRRPVATSARRIELSLREATQCTNRPVLLDSTRRDAVRRFVVIACCVSASCRACLVPQQH